MNQPELPDERFDDPTVELPTGTLLSNVFTTVLIPGAIVLSGVLCMGVLFASRSGPERTKTEAVVVEVRVREIHPTTRNATVQGTGEVRAAKSVRLTPQVQGAVVRQADNLAPGSRFAKGDILATIDARDYRAVVAAKEQAMAQAELTLATEQNRSRLAKREWELLGKKQEASALTLRLPQLKAAQKGLEAAQASLDQAKANLGRTQIRAPFNGVVTTEDVDVGQLVGPNTPIVTFTGTDAFWVDVSMPVEKLDGITFPTPGNPGSAVDVVQKLGAGREIRRSGQVLQIGGQLDAQSRTATVLVEIKAPYDTPGLPLLPGAHISATIDGKALQDTWEIPRNLIDQGRYIWVVDQESALRRRELQIGWRTPTSVIATGGLKPGDRVAVSNLILPVDGQTVIAVGEEG